MKISANFTRRMTLGINDNNYLFFTMKCVLLLLLLLSVNACAQKGGQFQDQGGQIKPVNFGSFNIGQSFVGAFCKTRLVYSSTGPGSAEFSCLTSNIPKGVNDDDCGHGPVLVTITSGENSFELRGAFLDGLNIETGDDEFHVVLFCSSYP